LAPLLLFWLKAKRNLPSIMLSNHSNPFGNIMDYAGQFVKPLWQIFGQKFAF
jgi:hypothetical protein